MYLMYDEEGTFMGVLNEKLRGNCLMTSTHYFFVKVPEQLEFDEETNEWKVPTNLEVF